MTSRVKKVFLNIYKLSPARGGANMFLTYQLKPTKKVSLDWSHFGFVYASKIPPKENLRDGVTQRTRTHKAPAVGTRCSFENYHLFLKPSFAK